VSKPKLSEIRLACDGLLKTHTEARAILERRLIARLCRKLKLKKKDIRYATILYDSRTVEYEVVKQPYNRRKHIRGFVSKRDHDLWFAVSGMERWAKYIEDAL
jgi:hypothetical protein